MLSMIIIRMPIMIIRREGLLECPDDGRRSVGSHTTTAPHRSASIQTLFQFRFLDSSNSSKLSLCVNEKILEGHLPQSSLPLVITRVSWNLSSRDGCERRGKSLEWSWKFVQRIKLDYLITLPMFPMHVNWSQSN